MYNHFRTLLWNLPGADPRIPGGELVPLDFRPPALPAYLQTLRQRLFGATPDTVLLNYRIRQLLSVVHAADLDEFVYALDPRVTYSLEDSPYPDRYFGVTADRAGLDVSGDPAAPDESGSCEFFYTVVEESNQVSVTGLNNTTLILQPNAFTGGLAVPVALGVTGYRVQARATQGPWFVTVRLRPTWGLPELLASLMQADAALTETFGANRVEPYATFRALWESHTELPSRLGGAICALVYRTEEERRRGGT